MSNFSAPMSIVNGLGPKHLLMSTNHGLFFLLLPAVGKRCSLESHPQARLPGNATWEPLTLCWRSSIPAHRCFSSMSPLVIR